MQEEHLVYFEMLGELCSHCATPYVIGHKPLKPFSSACTSAGAVLAFHDVVAFCLVDTSEFALDWFPMSSLPHDCHVTAT